MAAASEQNNQSTAAVSGDSDLTSRVLRVLEAIRPAVQSDGGDVELVGITADGTVQVRFHGACIGCPSSSMTLKMGLERNIRAHVPEVHAVEAVE